MMATIERDVRLEIGTSQHIDAVMSVMDKAFGNRFGEAWTRSQLAGILPMGGVSLMLAREPESDDTIGFSLVRVVADEAELLLIAVAPRRHRRGIGRRLLEDFLERSRNEGIARVHLEVREGNPAVSMYRAAGFSPVGRRRNYYHGQDGSRFDAITLACHL
jgi:[ribosomal protein S18]-alanine N-acetyltransferase